MEQLLQERSALRLARGWARADTILQRLEGLGVAVDDKERSWGAGPKPARQQQKRGRTPTTQPAAASGAAAGSANAAAGGGAGGVPCGMCGRLFPSRNLVFKHLRDGGTTGCGASVVEQGGLEPSPGEQAKAARPARRARQQRPGQTARHATAESCLWFGDLPLPWTRTAGKHRRLIALLYQHTPRGVPQPWLKKVVRKGYREGKSDGGAYLGYAIVAFRDKAEAQAVLPAMDGLQITPEGVFRTKPRNAAGGDDSTGGDGQTDGDRPTGSGAESEGQPNDDLPRFTLKVRPCEHGDTAAAVLPAGLSADAAGKDPPAIEQLRPLPEEELTRRLVLLSEAAGIADLGDAAADGKQTLASVVSASQAVQSRGTSRQELRSVGQLVPSDLLQRLETELSSLRWPAKNQRAGLSSERYLVLPTNVSSDAYGDLRALCKELMQWAAPEYHYSGIAVTKNFVASPHIDDRDVAHQFCLSLGQFTHVRQNQPATFLSALCPTKPRRTRSLTPALLPPTVLRAVVLMWHNRVGSCVSTPAPRRQPRPMRRRGHCTSWRRRTASQKSTAGTCTGCGHTQGATATRWCFTTWAHTQPRPSSLNAGEVSERLLASADRPPARGGDIAGGGRGVAAGRGRGHRWRMKVHTSFAHGGQGSTSRVLVGRGVGCACKGREDGKMALQL